MSEKSFIEALYAEKAKNDSNSSDLARTLNILSKTVFGDVNRFVFELLQNADDAKNSDNSSEIHVEFRLVENYLIFSHTGTHFSNDDVNGISKVGSGDSKKDKDIEKTGYKGIGFKSVFGSSDYVHIVSNKFSFRFDKNYEKWKGQEDFPWQVIPIWTDSVQKEISSFVDTGKVNTIIKFADKEKIKSEIENVFADCQIVLFLRNIKSVSFLDSDKLMFRIEKREVSPGIRGLYKTGILLSSWITKDYFVEVDNTLREKLSKLSDHECPQKLKESKLTKITFAAKINGDEIISIKEALIYCYLPTKVSKNFPYIINGDFITNAERTQFLTNDWNDFLFENIAIKQFEWVSELQTSIFKFQTTKLIKKSFSVAYNQENIEKRFNTGFQTALTNVAFLPEAKNDNVLKINSAIVDTTGYCELYPTSVISDFLNTKSKFLDRRLVLPDTIISIGAIEFGIEDLCNFFNSDNFKNNNGLTYDLNIKTIEFLFNSTTNGSNGSWIEMLKQTSFLLNENGKLKAPKEIYLPISEIKKETNEFITLDLLHKNVFDYFKNNKPIISWLSSLGVNEPTLIEIVRKSIFDIINNNQITEVNYSQIIRFVFKVFLSGQLNDSDYVVLNKIKLNTSNGLKYPSDSYLSEEYKPQLKLNSIVSNANFVSVEYVDVPEQINQWKDFLVKIGVKENISLLRYKENIERTRFIRDNKETSEYFDWLDKGLYPPVYVPYCNSGQHSILNFTTVNFIEYLATHSLSKMFWQTAINSWDKFLENCNHTTYHYFRGKNNHVPSYVQFYVKTRQSFPAIDGKCYKSTDLYIPELKTLIGEYFPVADLEGYIKKEQIEFFGLKRRVTIGDCIQILNSLESKVIDSGLKKQTLAIYEQIIKAGSDITLEETKSIQKWKDNGMLLVGDNTFQKVSSSYCFGVEGLEIPVNSNRFVNLPSNLTTKEIKAFSVLFDIPLVTFDSLSFVPENLKQEIELSKRLIFIAKYISVILAHKNSDSQESTFKKIYKIISGTKFFNATNLSLVYTTLDKIEIFNSTIESWHDGNKFYYIGKWNSPLTLYSLSDSLCRVINAEGIERELALFLQLSEDEIKTWLTEKGYKIDFIPSIIDSASEIIIDDSQNLEQELTIGVEEVFNPEIKANEVDVSKIKTENRLIDKTEVITKGGSSESTQPQAKIDIGRWSEECINTYLEKKYGNSAKVIWNNKVIESYLPYDFEIIQDGVHNYIEVKGTPKGKTEIYLTKNEWKFMFEKGDSYSIYRLFNAGTKDELKIEVIGNPSELIKNGKTLDFPISLYL